MNQEKLTPSRWYLIPACIRWEFEFTGPEIVNALNFDKTILSEPQKPWTRLDVALELQLQILRQRCSKIIIIKYI